MAGTLNRPATLVVTGSGVAGPMTLTTSGMLIDRQAVGVTWEVRWNMDGTSGSGIPPISMGLATPAGGTTSPLLGGAPAGVFVIEGSNDNLYYTDLGVTVSSLFGVSTSGTRLINITGALPDWMRLVYKNTASSGVFNVAFGSRGYGGG